MSKTNKALPTPPGGGPPSRRNQFEQHEESDNLTMDNLTSAMAHGKLDEFLKQEFEGNDQAKKLAEMMMGMTGMSTMMPDSVSSKPEQKTDDQSAKPASVPEEVVMAAQKGDLDQIKDLLRKEHQKRGGDPANPDGSTGTDRPAKALPADETQGRQEPAMDKNTIKSLMKIAQENNVSIEWVINRAISLYMRDYLTTGRL